MNGLISVIIPVYNVEKYLSQCLESVVRQTYHNLEIILIDDSSIDGSARICDEYAERDTRIVVIHKQNGGAASARNAGLRVAKGDYLAFVDSDDFLEADAFAKQMAIMERTGADVVESAFSNDFIDRKVDRVFFRDEKEFDTVNYLKLYNTHWICGLAWDKLFKKDLFKGIFYEEGHKIDDEFFVYQGIMNAKKVVYVPTVLYHYRMRASSVMRDKTAVERILFDRLEYSSSRREKVIAKYPELKQDFDYSYLDSLLAWSKSTEATVPVVQEIQRLIKEYFNKNEPCDMKLRFRLQLLRVKHAKPERILKKNALRREKSNKEQETKKDQNQYYD